MLFYLFSLSFCCTLNEKRKKATVVQKLFDIEIKLNRIQSEPLGNENVTAALQVAAEEC